MICHFGCVWNDNLRTARRRCSAIEQEFCGANIAVDGCRFHRTNDRRDIAAALDQSDPSIANTDWPSAIARSEPMHSKMIRRVLAAILRRSDRRSLGGFVRHDVAPGGV